MSNFNQEARRNMITQQVRAWDVVDDDVLDLMASVPRDDFVPEAFRSLAYADMHTPIGDGKVMLPPKEEGRILQALEILPTETVLEIGTGTGYLTSLLAKQANHVYSIDISEAMTTLAHANLGKHDIDNVTLETGDGAHAWRKHAPYDVIVVTASMPALPIEFAEQLNEDGRIFAILGEEPTMEAMLLTKLADGRWEKISLFETVAPRLKNVVDIKPFVF